MKRFALILSFISILSFCYSQDTELPNFISDSLDSYIEKSIEQWNVPAVAVGIVKDGKVIYEKGFGIKEVNTNNEIDEHTLFMIGSNTKAFTGTMLAMLEQEGKCSLNDKVIKWLPEFKLKDSNWTKEANLVDIVTHRMGFETFQGDMLSFDSDLTEDEYIEKIGKITPLYDFRTKWGYSNAGYMLAGRCISNITNDRWQNYLQKAILDPLEMDETVITVDEMKTADNVTVGHSIIDHKLQKMKYGGLDLVGPAASMSSSIHDMNKWTMALLDSGNYKGENVIPFKAIKRTRIPESIKGFGRHAYNKTNYYLYGLGWELMDYERYNLIMHTGGVHGYLTSVTLVPEKNLGVVVLTNTDQNWLFVALKWEIIDAFLNLPYRNYSENWANVFERNIERDSSVMAVLKDSVNLNLKPELNLKKFVGDYNNDVYGKANIRLVKDRLELTLEHHKEVFGIVEYIGNQRFLCSFSDPTFGTKVFPFKYNDNKVDSFVLSVNDFWEFTTYTFKKVE